MAHTAYWTCDLCGDAMKDREEVSAIAIQIAQKVDRGRPREPTAMDMMFGTKIQGLAPRVEEYHFCPECVMGLLIGLKLRRTKAGKAAPT